MKKLKKELNKLLPKGWEVKGLIKNSMSNTYNLEKGYLKAVFKIEEKEKQPEWIRIIEDAKTPVKLNHIYKVEGWEIGFPIVKGIILVRSKWQPATPAEIEAHKLGFHVGDEVYDSDGKFKIYSFDYSYGFLCVLDSDGKWVDIRFISKNQPKQPILQIDGKYLFYGDEYWWIDKSDNWKLETDFIKDCHSKKIYWNDNDILARFTTKEKALEYVLEEAYRVFDGCDYVYLDKEKVEKNIIGEFSIRKIIANGTDFGILDKKGIWLWCEASGWLATPIKNNLMLGEYEVTIENGVIKAKDGQVTKQEWNDWYQKFKIINAHCSYFTIELGVYTVKSTSNHISIGCIGLDDEDSVTLDQIEAINKAVNEL